jgi:outer membrane protein assembly factor BamB
MSTLHLDAAILLLAAGPAAFAGDWSQWRGAARNGVVSDSPPLIDNLSSNQLPLAWEAPLPQGTYKRPYYSSPIAVAGRAYLHISPGVDGRPPPPAAQAPKPVPKKKDTLDLALSKADAAGGDDDAGTAATADLERAAAKAAAQAQARAAAAAKEAERAVQKKNTDADDVLLCFDLATGREVWRFRKPGGPTGLGAPNTPCVADGRIYFIGVLGKLYCLDAATGELQWETDAAAGTQRGQYSSSPLVAEGKVIVADAKMRAFSVADGKKAWEVPVGVECCSPAVWRKDGRTFVIQVAADIVCVDVINGNVVWKVPGGAMRASTVVGDDFLVSFSQPNTPQIYRLGLETAEPIAELKITPAGMGHQSCTPSIESKRLYFWDAVKMYCYDMEQKSMVWQGESPRDGKPSPIVADGKVIGNNRGKVVVLDAKDGKTLISAAAAIADCTSCALTDGKLLANGGTHLRCYNLAGP